MLRAQIKVGGLYKAKISGIVQTVRVDAIRTRLDFAGRDQTVYDITNLATRRTTTFKSAAKFRSEASPAGPMPSQAVPDATSTCDAQPEGKQCSDPTSIAVLATPSNGAQSAASQPAVADAPTIHSDTIPGAGFASRLAAAQQVPVAIAVGTRLTDEQAAILAIAQAIQAARASGQQVLVIGAGAGTGKTFTLKQLEQVLRGKGQYTAFNTSLVAESKAKFTRAACNTTHSLAFRAVGRLYEHRLRGARVRSHQIAQMLGIQDFVVELEGLDERDQPRTKRLKAGFLAGQVLVAIRKFCMSADRAISAQHIAAIDGIDSTDASGKRDYSRSNLVRDYLLPFAQAAWTDLRRTDGALPFAHDVYVKLWQLGTGNDRPVIAADYILLDEAQDTAPVFLDILKQQEHALLIFVGDSNQAIYEWRGAVDAMRAYPQAPRKLLSQSFRFGQAVADVANSVLAQLEDPTDLIMRGLESIPTRVCEVKEPRCYLYRTNAGAVGRLMQAMGDNKRGHLIGGSKEVVDFCRAAMDLQAGRGTQHPELGCFADWNEVVEYSAQDEGQDLRLMVKLIKEFRAEKIVAALEHMPKEEDADLILSTAHKSKGREWASVKLGPDFPTANKMTDADRRLLYVAATRAQEELDISECPTFCGGYDKQSGGEDGNGGESKWVPGIPVKYTTEMPSEEVLATYRAARLAAKLAAKLAPAISPPQPAAVALPGPNDALPAPAPQDAAAAIVAAGMAIPAPIPQPARPAAPVPSGEAIRQLVAGTAGRVVTYTKLPQGEWGLWASAPITEGEVVEIRTRTGAIKREKVGKVIMVNAEAKKWLATIAR